MKAEIKLMVNELGEPFIHIRHHDKSHSIEQTLLGLFISKAIAKGIEVGHPSGYIDTNGNSWENYELRIATGKTTEKKHYTTRVTTIDTCLNDIYMLMPFRPSQPEMRKIRTILSLEMMPIVVQAEHICNIFGEFVGRNEVQVKIEDIAAEYKKRFSNDKDRGNNADLREDESARHDEVH